jgi:hypothetical protein
MAAIIPAATKPAQATQLNGWMMCWVPGESKGAHECVMLPSNWHIPGVRKLYCTEPYYRCTNATETFMITRSTRRAAARYAPIRTLDYGSVVTIYSGVYRR